jgi:molecular chaperone IbpA
MKRGRLLQGPREPLIARPAAGGRLTQTLLKEDAVMFDFTPLYRSTVGFDRLAQMLGEASKFDAPSYPPYNIERLGENEYRITMAVAGFSEDDISIEVKQNALTVTANKAENGNGDREMLHQGIAARSFERRFQLADHVEVTGADLEHGLLHITLRREVPEAMKPRKIAIASAKPATKTIEGKKAA